jgi:predicted TIM-barrel fold metal-dependent hydrolase
LNASKIDVHLHILPAFYSEEAAAAGRIPAQGRFPVFTEARMLEVMDANGIGAAVTSVSQPGVHFGDDAAACKLARRCNDYAELLRQDHPARLGAFATLPLPDVAGSMAEADRALDAGFEGVCLFTSYGGRYLGDPWFDPLMALLNRRRAVVFVHPTMPPECGRLGLQWPGFMAEYVFDTTRAAINLVFTRTLERYPDIRFILSHAGGTLPFIAWRLSVSPLIDPRLPQLSQQQVYAELSRFYFDTALSPTDVAFNALSAMGAGDRVLFGSDWPFAPEPVLQRANEVLHASEAARSGKIEQVCRRNAEALFPRLRTGVSA